MLIRVKGKAGVKIYDSHVNEWYENEVEDKAKEAYADETGEEPDDQISTFSFDECTPHQLSVWAVSGEVS